ncbi:MAG: aldehyde dehydrogenase [Sphaerochaetaceae bacterium]|nr:aldehyde dehydrogenase [Sphaerochaetaceae bacterium]
MDQKGVSIADLVEAQREFFFTEKTRSYDFRLNALVSLKQAIISHEDQINEALKKDLNKSPFESYMTEIGMALDDLGFAIKHLKKWMKPERVATPISQFAGKSFIYPEPFGVALIMAPWNYPVQLCIEPLCGAIAGGNTAVVKPSAYVPNVSQVLADLIADTFPPEYITAVQGGRAQNTELLEQKFDYIFFTGSPAVGHLVMEKASKNLTPVSLELGGKSPVIIEKTADLKMAARRLAFGKYLNAGQTCVAPDYVMIDKSVKQKFIPLFIDAIKQFFPDGDYSDMPVIVNDKHFARISALIAGEKLLFGGKTDSSKRFIEPTVLDDITFESPVMQEEIFGPVMPFIEYTDLDKALYEISRRPKPLALYLFTSDKEVERKVLQTCSFGGGCINDTIIHLCSEHMGFGGVGNSGMGSYHGKRSFDTFTHFKSIMDKACWIDLPMRYHPYTEKNSKFLRMFLK